MYYRGKLLRHLHHVKASTLKTEIPLKEPYSNYQEATNKP